MSTGKTKKVFGKRKKDLKQNFEGEDRKKPKMRFTTRLFFWAFIMFSTMSIFLFWTGRGTHGNKTNMMLGVVSVCFAVFFALLCFVRFIRSRSITGGLFLTTCISTGVFLGVSQFVPMLMTPAINAFGMGGGGMDVANGGVQFIIVLAQIGLFAVWFGLLLFTIFLYVQPVKRIDKYLGQIIDGDDIRRVKIGRARQYKEIEQKLKYVADRKIRPQTTRRRKK